MSAVFADTFFYLALMNDNDSAHDRALSESRANRPIVTSEFVLLELGNACARAEDHADFIALIEGMRASPRMTIVPLDSQLAQSRPATDEQPTRQGLVVDRLNFLRGDGGRRDHGSLDRRPAF